jgi:hypothetical protein
LQNQVQTLVAQRQALELQNAQLQEQLAQANTSTPFMIPYVVESSQGNRSKAFYQVDLKGSVDTTAAASLSNQTADWAMNSQNMSQKIYQLMGGQSLWGEGQQPEYEFNPDQALNNMANSVFNPDFTGKAFPVKSLPELILATIAPIFAKEGLNQYPAASPGVSQQFTEEQLAALGLTADDLQMPNIRNKNDLAQWQTQTLINHLGAMPQQIQVGDQPVLIPDMSSALTELLTLSTGMAQSLSGLQSLAARSGFEAAAAHQEAAVTRINLNAIIDYLNFDFEEVTTQIPMALTLPGREADDDEQPII